MSQDNFKKMDYIQRGKSVSTISNHWDSPDIRRVMRYDYMGSAEFESGALLSSNAFLRSQKDLEIKKIIVKDAKGEDKVFWGISTPRGNARLEEMLQSLIDGRQHTKGWTQIYDAVNIPGNTEVDIWLDVSPAVNHELTPECIDHPCYFTMKKQVAVRVFLELYRTQFNPDRFNHFEFSILDKAYCYQSANAVKITGLNEDDSITVKFHQKKSRYSKFDLWPVDKFPVNVFQNAGIPVSLQ